MAATGVIFNIRREREFAGMPKEYGTVKETDHAMTIPKLIWMVIFGFAVWMTHQAVKMSSVETSVRAMEKTVDRRFNELRSTVDKMDVRVRDMETEKN